MPARVRRVARSSAELPCAAPDFGRVAWRRPPAPRDAVRAVGRSPPGPPGYARLSRHARCRSAKRPVPAIRPAGLPSSTIRPCSIASTPVRDPHGGRPVRDHHRRAALQHGRHRPLHRPLRRGRPANSSPRRGSGRTGRRVTPARTPVRRWPAEIGRPRWRTAVAELSGSAMTGVVRARSSSPPGPRGLPRGSLSGRPIAGVLGDRPENRNASSVTMSTLRRTSAEARSRRSTTVEQRPALPSGRRTGLEQLGQRGLAGAGGAATATVCPAGRARSTRGRTPAARAVGEPYAVEDVLAAGDLHGLGRRERRGRRRARGPRASRPAARRSARARPAADW
ncbi:hypothetical protein SMICM304S_11570 [Streptomyces microflavus]